MFSLNVQEHDFFRPQTLRDDLKWSPVYAPLYQRILVGGGRQLTPSLLLVFHTTPNPPSNPAFLCCGPLLPNASSGGLQTPSLLRATCEGPQRYAYGFPLAYNAKYCKKVIVI